MGVVVSVRGACRSEHAHNVSKWHPTINLTTECAKKVRSECLKVQKNNSTTDLRYKMESIYTQTKVRGQGSLVNELALEDKKKRRLTFYCFYTATCMIVFMNVLVLDR